MIIVRAVRSKLQMKSKRKLRLFLLMKFKRKLRIKKKLSQNRNNKFNVILNSLFKKRTLKSKNNSNNAAV